MTRTTCRWACGRRYSGCVGVVLLVVFAGSLLARGQSPSEKTRGGVAKPMDVAVGTRESCCDWAQWRGPRGDGISHETGWLGSWPASGPPVLWQAQVGTGFSSMAVAAGRVYTMGNTGKKGKGAHRDIIWCFDAVSGETVWQRPYPSKLAAKYYEGGPGATPTVEGDRVYTLSKHGVVFCLEASSGKVVWTKDLRKEAGVKPPTWAFAGSPLIWGKLVIYNTGSAGVALDKMTGEVAWKSEPKGASYATPKLFRLGASDAIALFTGKSLKAVRAADGKALWSYPWKTSYDINAADPLFFAAEGTVFITSGYGSGCALLEYGESGCKERWRNREMRSQIGSVVAYEGHLYGFNGQVGGKGVLKCLSYQTGEARWEHKGLGTGTLMLAEGKLIVLSEKGKLVIVEASPAEYKPLQEAQILEGKCWTQPVLSHGKVYARNAVGDMVCVDVTAGR